MSRTSHNSHADSRRIGASILARIPAACRNAFDTLGLAGRSKSAAPPFARNILFETLEPRLLLSADLNPAATSLNPQDQPGNDFAVSSTYLSLSDDSASSGLAVVRVSGLPEFGADSWQMDLPKSEVVPPSLDTSDSRLGAYPSLGDTSGRETAVEKNSGPGADALIGGQDVLLTGTYYVQIRPAGEAAVSGPYELLVEQTHGVQQELDGQFRNDIQGVASLLPAAGEEGRASESAMADGLIVASQAYEIDADSHDPVVSKSTDSGHYNGQDFDVQIETGIHLATGQVYAHFYSIDPNTSLPPDVLTGFLPPEDGTGCGMGHVSYLIDQKPGLATGTEIRNIALISFDGQPWIATNQVDPHDPSKGTDPAREALNTIDAGAPTSAVEPLPPTRTRPDFLVQWTSTDDAGGSGVASQDIYVSTDGGSYVLWKDDITATSATFTGQAGHSYAFYSVAQDHVGHTEAAPAIPDTTTQVVDGLAVTAVVTDTSGAAIRFNRALDPATLNLYATETGGQGPADVTLVGATTGSVAGSLVLDDDLQGLRFVKTGGPLAPDTYTLTLRSAANGVIDTLGNLLDGDDNGAPGGDYVTTLAVVGPLPRVLSLPDVVRGPGQPANIPATVSGIPIRLSDGSGVESIEFALNYDPTLLSISDVIPAAGLPAGSTLAANLTVPGQVRVAMAFPTPLAAGAQDLVKLTAAVPATAPYRAKQVLDLTAVSVNEGRLAAIADDAVHLVAYFGDATGNGSYSSLDGQRVLRQTVGLDSGFAAYPLADPVLVADITANAAVSSLDATRILQEVVGIDSLEIPPLPVPGLSITPTGADPYVHIPTNLSGTPGSLITAPVLIDDAVGVESADLRLSYDPALLEFVAVRGGSVTLPGETNIVPNPTPGRLAIAMALTQPRPAGGGSLVEIDFRIKASAAPGATALNLTQVSLNEDGLVLTPLPVPGPDATDGQLTIHGAANTAPIAVADDYLTDEGSLLTIAAPGLLGNDSDVDGDPLTALLVSGPAHGALNLNPDGSFSYLANSDYFGTDSFSYRANDGQADSNLALATLTIKPVNDAPVASDDDYSVHQGQTLAVSAPGLLANDSDADGDPLTARRDINTAPQHGSVSLNSDGSFVYSPHAGYVGADSFDYVLSDGALTDTATIRIHVTDNAPDAVDDGYTVHQGQTLQVPASTGALANDSDADGDPLTTQRDINTAPQHGSVSLSSDGSFVYSPHVGYVGADSFDYVLSDGALTDTATIRIHVTDIAPDAVDDGYTVHQGQTLQVPASTGALANDSDADGDPLTTQRDINTAPQHGSVSLNSDGSFVYSPHAGYVGADSFDYVLSDGALTDTATIRIHVTGTAPEAVDDRYGVHQGQTLTVPPPTGVLANDTDADGDRLTASLATFPQHGVLSSLNLDGSFDYTPDGGYVGLDSFTYTVSDGALTDTATVSIEVTPPETLRVSHFTPTSTGFRVRFNRPIEPSVLNLYDTESGGLGAADVTVTGSSGLVKGSMVVDADAQGITFIRSGGALAADTYTLRLESAANAFKDTGGGALDGNGDGSAGDAFSTSFATVALDRTLSLPDFVRGPGQFVDLTAPSQTGFLPLYLSDGAGVTRVEFVLHYDPAKLDVQALSAAVGLPATATIERLPAPDGILKVRISSPSALAAGRLQLLNLQAFVPTTAAYGAKQVLDLDAVLVNGQAAIDDDALQLVSYFGDSSGNAAYTTLDAQQIQRVLVKLDSGFAAYPNVDPLIVADINGSGTLTSIDASRVLQEVSYLADASKPDRLEIPPIPAGIGPIHFSGPDPRVDIPVDAIADPGELVAVPIRIDTTAGLESVQLRIGYDASRFDLVGVRRGSVSGDFGWFISGQEPGRITVDMSRLDALQDGSGTLLDLDLRVKADALPGVSAIDLQYASLNDGRLTLNVVPQIGTDATDGRITIAGKAAVPADTAVAAPLADARSDRLPQQLQPSAFAGGWYSAPVAGDARSSAPVIDLAASFSLPPAVSEAMLADSKRKPWLKDYLGNVGQVRKVSPNAGLKVTVAVPPAISASGRVAIA